MTKSSENKIVRGLSSNAQNMVPLIENTEWKNINAITYNEIISSNPDPIKNILHPWLQEQGIAIIYAATGVGKTLFTLNVAYAIASGGSFLKFKAPKPLPILYVDAEMAYSQIHNRIMKIVGQQGKLDFPNNLFLLNPMSFPNNFMPQINTVEGQNFYEKQMEKTGAKVLFLDNFSTLTSIDENVSEQWHPIQKWFIKLRSLGYAVVGVHHSGKGDTKGYRGTSRMLDCCDTAISLQNSSQEQLETENNSGMKITIDYQKNRNFHGSDAFAFDAFLDDFGWSHQSKEISLIDKIIDRLKLKMTHKEIGIELGKSRPYISKLIKKAITSGKYKPEE